jgi:hypothetical protein
MIWKTKNKQIENIEIDQWKLDMMNNRNVRKEEFLEKYTMERIKSMDKTTFEYCLGFHTKFAYHEQCQFNLHRTFEGIYYVDVPNADYLSHYFIPSDYDGGGYLFEHKCNRASYSIFYVHDGYMEHDEKSDSYKLSKEIDWENENHISHLIGMRLRDIEYTQEFLENLLDRNVEFTKEYKRNLKIKQIIN